MSLRSRRRPSREGCYSPRGKILKVCVRAYVIERRWCAFVLPQFRGLRARVPILRP